MGSEMLDSRRQGYNDESVRGRVFNFQNGRCEAFTSEGAKAANFEI